MDRKGSGVSPSLSLGKSHSHGGLSSSFAGLYFFAEIAAILTSDPLTAPAFATYTPGDLARL